MALSLTKGQRKVLKACLEGQHVFFTGVAGTGKSFLLHDIISKLKEKYTKKEEIAVTASTGLAAVNIGGVTLNSFAGIGLGQGSKEEIALSVRASFQARKRWARCKTLIIDEISQLSAEQFELIVS